MATLTSSPRDSPNERSPLVSPTRPPASLRLLPGKRPWIWLAVSIFLVISIIDVGKFLGEIPRTRLYEANICLNYYRENDPSKIDSDGNVPETLCKLDVVQQKLTIIVGWQNKFDTILGILLAVPFGALADRVGRKRILTASLVGLQLKAAWVLIICYFTRLPLQLTWLSSVFYLIGGGPITAMALAITMLSDIVPPEKRTIMFLYQTASVLVAETIAAMLALQLVVTGSWLPLLISLAIQQVGVLVTVISPETLRYRDLSEPEDRDDQAIEPQIQGHGLKLEDQIQNFHSTVRFFKSDRTLAMVIFTFMINSLGGQGMNLIVIYALMRYRLSMMDISYLLSFRTDTYFVAVAALIPIVYLSLLKYLRLSVHSADVWIARVSIVLTTISFLIMGIATHLAMLILGMLIFNLGTGYTSAMRSIAIHIAGGQASTDIGKLMCTIAVVESVGAMIAVPLLNQLLQWGGDLDGVWLGLPFFVAMLAFAGVTVLTFAIAAKDKGAVYVEVRNEDEDDEDEESRSSAMDECIRRGSCYLKARSASNLAEPLDLDAARKDALAAATAAFARAQAQDALERNNKRSSDMSRSKSNASRKSLTSQGSHFPQRESSFRSLNVQKTGQPPTTQRHSRAPTMTTEQFPPFYPMPEMPISAPRPLSAQPSISFNENGRPSSQPKPHRLSASSSVTSQQIRKARSMYYASSIQTGSPISRPPAKYLTTPPSIDVSPSVNISSVLPPNRTMRPSPLAGLRPPTAIAPDETVDQARDKVLQGFQQRSIKHKPSIFLAPFKKRQEKTKEKGKHPTSGMISVSAVSHQVYEESTADITTDDFEPQPEPKERRSFSGSLKSRFKKVFRRTSNKTTILPPQQVEANRNHLGITHVSPSNLHLSLEVPSPDEETLLRARSRTPSLEVIHESKDSIGSEGERVATASLKRKSLPFPSLTAFRDPMALESLTEEASTPSINPKRVFSALMKEINSSKSTQAQANFAERTPGADSDIFESSKTKELHCTGREIHSSASRDFRPSVSSEQRPPSRRPASAAAQSVQSKASSIKSLGRAIRSTIRTVTPTQHRATPCPDHNASVRDEDESPDSTATFESGSHDNQDMTLGSVDDPEGLVSFRGATPDYRTHVATPSAEQIERRVERAKSRWKTPLDETEEPDLPRETNRNYTVTNFTQREKVYSTDHVHDHELFKFPTSPAPHPVMSPLSPSVYSRNTDGVSILPNDSVMSFQGTDGLQRQHDGGSAVILTSQSVRSYVIGTPSPRRRSSTRSSRDWKAWLSHEVSGMETTSQEELRIRESRRSSSNSTKLSRNSKPSPDSVIPSPNSTKATPSPKVYSDLFVPSTHPTTQRATNTTTGRSDGHPKSKENVTPSSVHGGKRPNTSPLGLNLRPKSLQPLSFNSLRPNTPNGGQYTTNLAESENLDYNPDFPATSPARPRVRATLRPISPEKLARRPKSAFDLRGAHTLLPRPTSELRRPALHLKISSGTLRSIEEPSHEAEGQATGGVLDERETTPGQRMADKFLRERKSITAIEGSGSGKKGMRGNLLLVREDTPAFL
ncbi:MFS general substrate transporter [Dothidotthia symphoricarpi CBS 119687]|uniref:MFS general substrate transporter n=1 Tax=Dothidotthia symphoricarpi CBS 119687 TaxID=1392245 RepID=A0A6A6AVF4_9PLEO|nr:MFS general substrate transporter [Dothidotthia symphoricarpi CBS 119687]KAF2134934.1 MFS general substrate transporter [Dothidotthia symphoricarpi CBS 119687]